MGPIDSNQIIIIPMPVKDPGSQQGVDIPVVEQNTNPFRGVSYGVDSDVEAQQSAYSSSVDPGSRVSDPALEKQYEESKLKGF